MQKTILRQLLKKYESSKTYSGQNEIAQTFSLVPEKVFPDYANDFADVDKIRDFENALSVLEHNSLVTLSKKEGRIHKITAVSTDENWSRIRTVLGVKDRNTRLQEEIAFYSQICDDSNSEQIVKTFCRCQIERLEAGKEARYTQEYAKNSIALLNFILKNKDEILERELSVSVLSNSKAWEEKYKSKVLKILRQSEAFDSVIENCADEKEQNKVILEECNVFANPSCVYFKGSGTISFENGKTIHIFLDIPLALFSASVGKITSFAISDSAIMTVENLTSFNRIKKADTFFIFLSGYHNSAKQNVLQKIFSQNPDKAYYHFGDIDPDGFFILENLRNKTNIDFKPYKMGTEELKKYAAFTKPLEKNDIAKARTLLQNGKHTDAVHYMLTRNQKLEQEIVSWKERDDG